MEVLVLACALTAAGGALLVLLVVVPALAAVAVRPREPTVRAAEITAFAARRLARVVSMIGVLSGFGWCMSRAWPAPLTWT
jgi:hypothetical protein